MSPRTTPSRSSTPKSFQPSADAATYRDLLLFEERLKTNVARLRRRKRRYQIFLLNLVLCIIILASDVLLSTNLLVWPLNRLMQKLPITPRHDIIPPPYLTQSAFLVAVTTMVLFYASGLYAEKIGYANRYVPHANKALRSFNMYLNVRTSPISAPWPFRLFVRSQAQPPNHPPPPINPGSRGKSDPSRGSRRPTTITPIPPSTNPRGELIFSSRVDKQFRESYERYRAAFERKRDERVLADAAAAASDRLWRWLPGTRGVPPGTSPEARDQNVEHEKATRTPTGSRSGTPVASSSKPPTPSPRIRRERSSSPAGVRRPRLRLDSGASEHGPLSVDRGQLLNSVDSGDIEGR